MSGERDAGADGDWLGSGRIAGVPSVCSATPGSSARAKVGTPGCRLAVRGACGSAPGSPVKRVAGLAEGADAAGVADGVCPCPWTTGTPERSVTLPAFWFGCGLSGRYTARVRDRTSTRSPRPVTARPARWFRRASCGTSCCVALATRSGAIPWLMTVLLFMTIRLTTVVSLKTCGASRCGMSCPRRRRS